MLTGFCYRGSSAVALPSVLPFAMRRVSVGVRGFSGMPEEAVTFARASQAIKASSWAPTGAAVPTVFY